MLGRILSSRHAVAALVAGALMVATLPAHAAELVDRLAAVVNGEIITYSELEKRVGPQLSALRAEPDPEVRRKKRQEILQATLDVLIGEKLLEADAKELELTVSDADLKLALDDVKAQNGLDDAQFERMLAQEGFSYEEYRRFMRNHLTRMKLMNMKLRNKVKVSEADLRSEYARYANAEGGDVEVEARHILIEVPGSAPAAEVEAARRRAAEFARRARQPDVDFDDLVSEAEGGDLGTFGRGVMMPDFERAAFALEPGEVSEPVRSASGWHVIQVTDRHVVPAKTFDEVKEQLRQSLFASQMERYSAQLIQELRQKASVELML